MIYLPGASEVKLKGRVRRSLKTPVISIKNGMGIEIIENDPQYISFIRSVYPDAYEGPDTVGPGPDISFQENSPGPSPDGALQPEFTIITCPGCSAKNKVNKEKLSLGPKCGRCGHPLTSQA